MGGRQIDFIENGNRREKRGGDRWAEAKRRGPAVRRATAPHGWVWAMGLAGKPTPAGQLCCAPNERPSNMPKTTTLPHTADAAATTTRVHYN